MKVDDETNKIMFYLLLIDLVDIDIEYNII